jgi:hypothetical protein
MLVRRQSYFAWRIALLEGELAEVHQARDTTEENTWGLFDIVADIEWWWEESYRECQEWVEKINVSVFLHQQDTG